MQHEMTEVENAIHDVRNGIAGVRVAVQLVCERLTDPGDRAILSAVLTRLDRVSARVPELYGVDE